MTQTVLSVFGTRPEAVKMAPVVQHLEKAEGIQHMTCFTGQHRDMVKPILELFEIQPDYDLDVMVPDQTLSGLTARLLEKLDEVIQAVQPDWILAQGDTTTVLAASLVAYYHQRKFGHIEAGLRTDDKYRPFPEEGNRRVADVMADMCFAPTRTAQNRLLAEGIPANKILVTGNTVVDAVLDISKRNYQRDRLLDLPEGKRIILVTAHRRESFGEPFRDLCYALRDIATQFEDVHLVYPVHYNPNVQRPVYEILADIGNISLIDPLDYPDMIQLMQRSTFILTDSGGIQEEAPSFNVPLLVMRDTTERPEGIKAGIAKLVGTSRESIVREARLLLANPQAMQAMQGANPYGDGKAAQRIVDFLLRAAHE